METAMRLLRATYAIIAEITATNSYTGALRAAAEGAGVDLGICCHVGLLSLGQGGNSRHEDGEDDWDLRNLHCCFEMGIVCFEWIWGDYCRRVLLVVFDS